MSDDADTGATTECYPLRIYSSKNELIARINPDTTWSVRWDAVIEQAYRPATQLDSHLVALAQILLAGRDNFRTTPWETKSEWTFHSFRVGLLDPENSPYLFSITDESDYYLARLCRDTIWEIDWSMIVGHRRARIGIIWDGNVATVGLSELFSGARDNFRARTITKVKLR